jgi:hypothetical protein
LTADVQCVRFINGLANFTLKNQAKSHRAQKGYLITLVELQNFLNDVVTDSPELGNMRSSASPSAQPTRKRNFEDPLVEASKIWKRNGGGRGRGRGRGRGGNNGRRGQTSLTSTMAVFVLPKWAKFTQVTKNWKLYQEFPARTQLFTRQSLENPAQQEVVA